MPRSSMSKSFADLPPSPGAATHTHQARTSDFIPRYEETLNNNLRNFGDPEAHANGNNFDQTEEPTPRHGMNKRRRSVLIAVLVGVLLSFVAFGLGVFISRMSRRQLHVSSPSQAAVTIMSAETPSQSSRSPRSADSATVTTTETQVLNTTVMPMMPAIFATESLVAPSLSTTTETGLEVILSGAQGSPVTTQGYTRYITITQIPQTYFSYDPPTTSTMIASMTSSIPASVLALSQASDSSVSSAMEASKQAEASISSVLSSIEAKITSSYSSRHTRIVPSIYRASATPPIATSAPLSPPLPPSSTTSTTEQPNHVCNELEASCGTYECTELIYVAGVKFGQRSRAGNDFSFPVDQLLWRSRERLLVPGAVIHERDARFRSAKTGTTGALT